MPLRALRSRWWASPILAIVSAGAFVAAAPLLPPLCPIRIVLGIPCPSCGMTRAARLAATFHFAEATATHPLWIVVLPSLAAVFAFETAARAKGIPWGSVAGRPAVKRAAIALVIALIAVWVARFFGAFGGPVAIT